MTPNKDKVIDLNTPEADRQPRARHSALPYATAEASPIDLTAETPPPDSARGIADDEIDYRRGGDALSDYDRPPNLPRLHESRENARTSRSRALAPVSAASVTIPSLSPRKKKSRSQRRYSGKENSTSDVADRKSPFCPLEDNRKVPFLLPKVAPKGSKTLSPAVVDLAGKKSPVALSVSRLDSDTLSDNPFSGPREIPRFLNGVFVGQFLPQVQIPADHPQGDDIS